jgi:hypothetical protein
VAFEANAHLLEIEEHAFNACRSLQNISIPSSTTILHKSCFVVCTSLSSFTFEQGSLLTDIREHIFFKDSSLKVICLPASLQRFDSSALFESDISVITVEDGNQFFRIEEDFLWNIDEFAIVRYLGSSPEIQINPEIRELSRFCFSFCRFSCVVFESESELDRICESAFEKCSSLKSICIPSTVTVIGRQCFINCKALVSITFESGSRLEEIPEKAFFGCERLRSICIPESVRSLSASGFRGCSALSDVQFEPGSKLQEISAMALSGCKNLKLVCIPASVQSVDSDWMKHSAIKMLVLESGELFSKRTETDLSAVAEVCVPEGDLELICGDYAVRDCCDVPGFVSLVKMN